MIHCLVAVHFLILVLGLFAGANAVAVTPSTGITYTGRILDSDDKPVTASNVVFTLTISDPDQKCWLYREQRQLDLSTTAGSFSFEVGSNDSTLVSSSASLNNQGAANSGGPESLADVFSNKRPFTGLVPLTYTSCSGTYDPSTSTDPNEGRILAIYFSVNGGQAQALPSLRITPVPSALQAMSLNGYDKKHVLRIDPTIVNPSAADLNATQLTELYRLMNNPLTAYMPANPTIGGDITATSLSAMKVTGLQGAAVAAPISGDAGKVLTYNGTSYVWTTPATGGVTSLNGQTNATQSFAVGNTGTDFNISSSGGTHTFNIPSASSSNRGLLTSADWTTFNSKQSGTLANGQVWIGNASNGAQAQTLSGDATVSASGNVTVDKTQTAQASKILQLDSSGNAYVAGVDIKGTGASAQLRFSGSTNMVMNLPTTSGTVNQFLQTDGAGNLSWASQSAMLPTISAGQVWVGNASNGAQAFTLSGDIASVSNTGVVTLSSSATGSNKLPLAGGTMSGAINMGGNNISNAGDVSLAAGKFLGLGVGSTAGTVTGQMWYDSGIIKYFDGTSVQSLGVAGAGITSLNGLTSGTQSFVNGTSGTAPAFSSAGSAHTLNIPMASSASVTAGLISNADYASMMAKQSNSLAAGQVWVGNASGAAQAFSLSGDVASVSDTGLVTVNKTILGLSNKLLQLDNTGIANTYGVSIYGATSGQIYLSAMPTTTVYGLRFPATAPADNQILKANSSGDLSWVTYLANVSDSAPLTNGKMWIGNASGVASEVTMSGDATITNAGLLSLKNTGTAGTYTKVITDAQGRVTSGSALAASDITTALTYTPVNKAGDTMSGSLMLAAGQYLGLGSGSTAGTVAGQVWYDSGTIKYFDGTTAKSLGVAGAGITSINGATVSSQTFPVPGTSGTAPAWSINTGAGSHTLNIPMASAASVTAGLISNTDYAAFNAKMSNSLTGGQIWVGNSANVAQAMSLGGDVASVSNAGVVTLKSVGTVGTYWKVVTDAQGRVTSGSALASGDVTAALGYTPASANAGYVNGGNSFAGNATIGLNDAYTLGFKTGGSTRMTLDASGNLGIGTSAPGAVLDVRGPSGGVGGDTFRVSNPSGQTYLYAFSTADTSASLGAWSSSGSQKPLLINEGGTANVGVGNVASPGSLLSVAGNVAVGTYASSAAPTNGLIVSGNVGIGTASPGVALDVSSKTDAIGLPVGNTSQRPSNATGLLRYNTTTGGVEYNSGSAWNTVGTALGYTPVNRAGDTMSGSLMLAAGQYLGLGSGSTAGTVAGQMWYDSGVIKYFDGTTVKSLGVAGAGITSLNGLTANVQSFVVGSAGNAPAITSASSAHTIDIPMASASGSVTAGLISNTDYAAFNAKMSSTLNSTQVWVGNGSNAAEARTLSGDISISNVGLVTADKTTIGTSSKLQQLDASGVANALGIGLINSGTVRILPATPTTASYDLRLPAGSPAANQILQSDATGQMSWVTNTASSGYVNGGNTFAGNATIGLNDAYTLGFKTNNATRMTLDASGNFGIGTATPTAALDVNGAINISGTNGISYPSTDSTAGSSIAIGASALVQQYSLASAAYRNTAIGYQAMSNAGLTTAATKNTAVGYKAGANSTTGFQNTYIGYQAGSASGSGATRTSTAIGANATVNAGGSGYDVVLVGANSSCCTGGTGGVVVGASAAGSGNTGIAIGNSASQAGDNSIAIGYSSATAQAGAVALGITAKTASYNGVSIGSGAGSTNVSGNNNVLIGAGVGSTTLTTGARNLLIGVDSSVDSVAASTSNSMNIGNAIYATNMKNATNTSGVAKIGINNNSPASIFDITDTSTTTSALIVPRAATFTGTTVNGMIRYNTTSSQFEFYQNGAWVNYSTGSGSSLVVAPSTGSLIGGTTAASSVTTAGLNNIAYGYQTLNSNTTGSGNTAMGYQAIALDNSGYNNIAIGYQAAYSGGGNENTTVGSMAYYNSDSGNQNVAIGGYALNRSQGASGNTAVGYDAGDMLTSGAGNVILGWEAGNNLTTGSNNIVIGYNIGAPSATGSNQMTIGNMIYGTGINGTGTTPSTGKIGIGIASPAYTLSVNGTANATTFLMNGSSSAPAAKVTNAAEPVAVSATAATGTVNFYLASGAVQYYTSNASANWTLNWAWSSGTSLNTALSTNDSVTTTFLVTQGATAYYPSAFTIDGTSVTPKWLGGSAPTAGNPSSIDVYTCTIIKTASAVFSVLCSQAQYK